MNYANMIEEKNLKKTFIIATLCSTLVGTFTSSMGLWDRVNEKRRQKQRDTKQDAETLQVKEDMKKLREQVETAEQRSKDRENDLRRRPRDEIGTSFERSGMLIQREFDDGYGRLGRRFAMGDPITENQLQAQIIRLQQTVINVLQEALANNRSLSQADMDKLLSASQAAREGSVEALRGQYKRLARDTSPPRALPPPKRASTVVESDSIFCRYSLNLQYIPKKPLSASFAPGGDRRCPECAVRIDVDGTDVWRIGKRIPVRVVEGRYEKEILEDREFQLGQRFIVKCHTIDGGFACVLCNRYRDVDVLCGSVDTLVNHVGRNHDISELEKELDFEKRSLPMALPRAPSPPNDIGMRDRRFLEYR